ncbi:NADPH-dependent F420 reductase [Actinomarinicola tropica]|uniref:NADPH-dependent F420 reductase n=1 Tax=Actinomarinicola tropica TaxID=2789776 RepID=UPI00226C2562|nr:NADPH-dependent F420 reductase [Actinomarinicola tropica]
MVTPVHIGVLGATGPAGSGLAARLAASGHEVIIGSRSHERAVEVRDELVGRWPDHALVIEAGDNQAAAGAEVVVIATPWDGASTTAASLVEQLDGKVVICMANALTRMGKEFQPLVPPRGSVAGNVQAALPGSRVAAAMHHIPAKELGDLSHPVESDVLVCSDHASATDVTSELIDSMPDMRALDAGSLALAAPIEAFTAVLLQLNVRYKTRAAVKFTGITR